MDLFSFVKSRLSILDVAREYTALKQAGSYWKGVCPFHHEKTGSFTVSPHKEIYYCFGCHSGGDVINFIAAAEHCSAKEAVNILIERHHIELPQEILAQNPHQNDNNRDERKRYLACCDLFMRWAEKQLELSIPAQQYLAARGIRRAASELFRLGFVPKGVAAIKQIGAEARRSGFLIEDLVATHLLMAPQRGGPGYYSPFEDRIIFPIFSAQGECVGFGGRTWRADDQRVKYINSQEHQFFSKSGLLFGLAQAKKHIQKEETAIIVEGYTDCIALVDHGYPHTIATLGTACTEEHLRLISRYARKLIVMYDGDSAGRKAMVRVASLCFKSSIETRVAILPAGHDPASLLQSGGSVRACIDDASDVFTFFVHTSAMDKTDLRDKLSSLEEIFEVILALDDQLKQEFLLRSAADALNISFQTLARQLKKRGTSYYADHPEKKRVIATQKELINTPERELFAIVLLCPQFIIKLDPIDQELIVGLMPAKLAGLTERYIQICREQQNEGNPLHRFLEEISAEQKAAISRLIIEYQNQQPGEELFKHLLETFYRRQWKKCLIDAKMKIENSTDDKMITAFLEEIQKLKLRMRERGVL